MMTVKLKTQLIIPPEVQTVRRIKKGKVNKQIELS